MFPANRFDGMGRRFGGIPAGPCAKDERAGTTRVPALSYFCFVLLLCSGVLLYHNSEDRIGIEIFVMLFV